MTPIRGFFKRILAPQPTDDPAAAPDDRSRRSSSAATAPTRDDDPESTRKRRRGRRGGRGRRKDGEDAGNGPAATLKEGGSVAAKNGQREQQPRGGQRAESQRRDANGRGERRDYRWGRKVADEEAHELVEQRLERAQQRRRTNRRAGLDAPLPEDIAFRAAAEGGDRSILPARRRRPEGLRDTERVIIAGPRTLAGWMHWRNDEPSALREPETAERASAEAEAPATPDLDQLIEEQPSEAASEPRLPVSDAATEAVRDAVPGRRDASTADGSPEDGETTARRRRGRRGGRGRGRDREQERAAAAEMGDSTEPAEDDAADEVETETAPMRSRPATRIVDPSEFPPAFVALGIDPRTLAAIAQFGFADPTPIQERAIPALLNGLDVVGVAQTGSGKTVAFGGPMMERLDPDLREVQGIVLVPTRELAQQVLDVLDDLGKPWGIEAIGLLGGRRLDADFRALQAKPHVVVGTPGRIIDHLNRGTLTLRHVRYAVLDEADQMLDIGFLPDIRRILSRTPKRRQTALFSATMPSSIRRLVWQFMDDPETVSVDPELSTVESIEQIYMEVAQRDKVRGLRELIERELKGRTLVFSRTKRGVDHLEGQLSRDGVRVGALHGDMDQRRRDRVVQDFREGKLDILIATNVAARGLDIPEITHVVNYDVPQNAEEYVHRTGRTGRAGRTGKAITFVSEWDMEQFDTILTEFGDQIHKEEFDLYAAR